MLVRRDFFAGVLRLGSVLENDLGHFARPVAYFLVLLPYFTTDKVTLQVIRVSLGQHRANGPVHAKIFAIFSLAEKFELV